MKFEKIRSFISSDIGHILSLITVAIVAHALFIPWMGFYGDDWSLIWWAERSGSTHLFFPENRFLLQYLYGFFTHILAPVPWQWHSFLFSIRLLSGFALWKLVQSIWPNQPTARWWISVLYILYPGSLITYQPITYWVIYLQLTILFVSLWLMMVSLESTKFKYGWLIISILLAGINLITSEYLFFMELIRYPLFFLYLQNTKGDNNPTKQKNKYFWLIPFLLVFLFAAGNRVMLHTTTESSYYKIDISAYSAHPLETISNFLKTMIENIRDAGLFTWIQPIFTEGTFTYSGKRSIVFIACIAASVMVGIAIVSSLRLSEKGKARSLLFIAIGLTMVVLGSAPFWIAGLPIEIGMENYSRFTIPSAVGSAFLIYGITNFVFKSNRLVVIFFSFLSGCAIFLHLIAGNFFRNEWEIQNRFYWEMAWRMPAVEPGTTFYINETPFTTLGENSLSAAINWIQMDAEPPVEYVDYYLYNRPERFSQQFPQQPDQPFTRSHMAGVFSGNSSNLLVMWYQPPACLQVLTNVWDFLNPDIPAYLRSMASRQNPHLIHSQGNSEILMRENPIFMEENSNSFCYFYQKASLAADNQDWETVNAYYHQALQNGYHPNHALERIPFISGFLHAGQYEQAFSLSTDVLDISKSYQPVLCNYYSYQSDDPQLDAQQIKLFINEYLNCNE